ncbi:MAG: PTS sugar transporter subunit IIA [Dongiales bacterium]|jgi:PTS system nitrogen regulatory IIA component|nr:PTS sugar transporter subunit IIA [Caulobacteraceae bacterium]
MMAVGAMLDSGCISPRVTATSKRQALAVISEIAGRSFGLKPTKVLEALLEREAIAPTGVGKGIAVPHAQIEGLERMRAIFLRLEKPVEFDAVDDKPVDLIFAILAPPGSGSEHLRALARVSRIMRRADIREQLRVARGADAIHAILAQEVQISAA